MKKIRYDKFKIVSLNIGRKISAVLILLLLVVPTSIKFCMCYGIHSMPLFLYFFRRNLEMFQTDFYYFIDYPGTSLIVFGFVLIIISLIYQIINRNQILKKGPYKYLKHPQYLAICLMTLGFTIKSINTRLFLNPLQITIPYGLDNLIIQMTWIFQVMLYLILAAIENLSSKARYGEYYLDYMNDVKLNWKELKSINDKYLKLLLLSIVMFACTLIDFIIITFNIF